MSEYTNAIARGDFGFSVQMDGPGLFVANFYVHDTHNTCTMWSQHFSSFEELFAYMLVKFVKSADRRDPLV